MLHSPVYNRIFQVCVLAAATLILPVLAHTKQDNDKDSDGWRDDDRGNDRGEKHIPAVPEANAGWVLVPFFGAVLLLSARQLLRPMAKK
jgi:hypothetical protein